MSEKEVKTEATKTTVIVISAILHVVTIIAVVLLYFQDEPNPDEYAPKEHTHYEYADDSHSHSADEITYNSMGGFGKRGTIERALRDLDDKADNSHSHSAGDINYTISLAKYGSVHAKLDELQNEIDDKANKRHTHY